MKEDLYNENTYGGLVSRIRDGVALSPRQKTCMEQCGLTADDFRNQPTTAEKVEMLNAARQEGLGLA